MTNLLTVYRFISLCDGIVKYPLTYIKLYAVLVRELCNIKDFCLTITFFEYRFFIMGGNKYNFTF